MIKRLKTLEQIKEEWECTLGYKVKKDEYKSLRFYIYENIKSHITFKMLKYFGKNLNVEKANNTYYDWRIIKTENDSSQIWHFRDDWFVVLEDYSLEDSLFDI
jgi:ERCC4-type nuclease